jgi:hypothetical protein
MLDSKGKSWCPSVTCEVDVSILISAGQLEVDHGFSSGHTGTASGNEVKES